MTSVCSRLNRRSVSSSSSVSPATLSRRRSRQQASAIEAFRAVADQVFQQHRVSDYFVGYPGAASNSRHQSQQQSLVLHQQFEVHAAAGNRRKQAHETFEQLAPDAFIGQMLCSSPGSRLLKRCRARVDMKLQALDFTKSVSRRLISASLERYAVADEIPLLVVDPAKPS